MDGQSAPRQPDQDVVDLALAKSAVDGDQDALAELVRRHQGFVFSLAVRMLRSKVDAEDATQEILMRIVTNLSTFRGESAFRTWAYRVAVRHLVAYRSRRSAGQHVDFAQVAEMLDRAADQELSQGPPLPVDEQLIVEEVRATCLSGLLLCLDTDHRLAFVLQETFEATDTVTAELLGVSKENVRERTQAGQSGPRTAALVSQRPLRAGGPAESLPLRAQSHGCGGRWPWAARDRAPRFAGAWISSADSWMSAHGRNRYRTQRINC